MRHTACTAARQHAKSVRTCTSTYPHLPHLPALAAAPASVGTYAYLQVTSPHLPPPAAATCPHLQGSGLEHINDLNAAYQPLYYVLYFPRGEPGWHPDMLHRGASDLQECSVEEAAVLEDEAQDQHGHSDTQPKQRQRLTSRQWIAYHTHVSPQHVPAPAARCLYLMHAATT